MKEVIRENEKHYVMKHTLDGVVTYYVAEKENSMEYLLCTNNEDEATSLYDSIVA